MPNTVIENYEPDDKRWGVVIGPLAPRKPESHEQTLSRVLRTGESDVGANL
jgi:hypothetical protein